MTLIFQLVYTLILFFPRRYMFSYFPVIWSDATMTCFNVGWYDRALGDKAESFLRLSESGTRLPRHNRRKQHRLNRHAL